MVHSRICNLIAYTFAIGTFVAIFYSTYYFEKALQPDFRSFRTDEGEWKSYTETEISLMGIESVLYLALFISCLSVIVGINRRNHNYVIPWVIFAIIFALMEIVTLCVVRKSITVGVIATVASIVCWFPIFSLYRELRSGYNACATNTRR